MKYFNVDSGLLNRIWSAVPFAEPFFRKQCRDEDHRGRVADVRPGVEEKAASEGTSVPVHIFLFFSGI